MIFFRKMRIKASLKEAESKERISSSFNQPVTSVCAQAVRKGPCPA